MCGLTAMVREKHSKAVERKHSIFRCLRYMLWMEVSCTAISSVSSTHSSIGCWQWHTGCTDNYDPRHSSPSLPPLGFPDTEMCLHVSLTQSPRAFVVCFLIAARSLERSTGEKGHGDSKVCSVCVGTVHGIPQISTVLTAVDLLLSLELTTALRMTVFPSWR